MDKVIKFAANNKWLLMGLLAVMITAIVFRNDIKAFFKRTNQSDEDLATLANEAATTAPDKNKVLKKGDSGKEVLILQKYLLRDGGELPKHGADGIFGQETERALSGVVSPVPKKAVTSISLKDYEAGIWVRRNTGIAGQPITGNTLQDMQSVRY